VHDKLKRLVGKTEYPLFACALESGFLEATPKLREVHVQFLATDREEVVDGPMEEGKSISVVVRFDATKALEATEAETCWRLYGAGLAGLLHIAGERVANRTVSDSIRSVRASLPVSEFPDFPIPTDEQWSTFDEYAFYSKGKKCGELTIELNAPTGSGPEFSFQPVFDQITAALAKARLGIWQGDSGNDIEFRSRDVAAAQACVEKLLAETYDGTFKFTVLRD
jgi:hypothetical protein